MTVLDEAKSLTYGARNSAYGDPFEDFTRTARLWRAYFQAKGAGHVDIGPEDVGRLMILLKLSRELHTHTHDSLVDIAGYADCLARIHERD